MLAVGVTLTIAVLSLLPGEPVSGDRTFSWLIELTPALVQNPMHIVCYAALVVSWARVLPVTPLAAIAVACVTFGALLELGQTLVPGRYGSLLDGLLNGIGVWVGMLLARRLAGSHTGRA